MGFENPQNVYKTYFYSISFLLKQISGILEFSGGSALYGSGHLHTLPAPLSATPTKWIGCIR